MNQNNHQSTNSYIHLTDIIPTDLPNNAYITLERLPALKIYSLGFQPAKLIPEIPEWFLHKYTSPNALILEPFAGSGTTIISTLKLQRRMIWLDNHPLSQLICRVKTTRYSLANLVAEYEQIITQARKIEQVPCTVEFRNKDFWFQKPVQIGLEIIKSQINLSAPQSRDIFLLVFASTVRKCSDMNDGMVLAAKRQNIQDIPQRSIEDVFKYFNMYFHKAMEALQAWDQIDWCSDGVDKSASQDARYLSGDWLCDAVMTSPPYINAIDYVWASKFELHWLGFVKSNQDRLALSTREIGTERISSQEYKQLAQTGYKDLDELIMQIYTGEKYQASKGQNQLRARVVSKYFLDMQQHFSSCYQRLKAGGYYCFSIGDVSKICGVEIPVASTLSDIANHFGFREVFRFHLLLKNRRLNIPRNVDWASTIKHDTIIVLQKQE